MSVITEPTLRRAVTRQALAAPGTLLADARPRASGRLFFVDNMRVFLTILVLLHHLMITYAGSGDWYYAEGRQDFVTEALGSWFCSVNQAYFMGLFLLISAYFVPGSYDRKGAGRFMKDRLIRLGIPLVVFSWIINPLFVYVRLVVSQDLSLPLWRFLPGGYLKGNPLIGAGPLWFVETLLLFSLVYVLWRIVAGRRPQVRHPAGRPDGGQVEPETGFPGYGPIALLALLLGLAGFLVRLWVPMGWTFEPLNLQFPFFAQYIALFVIGLIAYHRNWLLGLPEAAGRVWLRVAGVLMLVWWPMALAGGAAESIAPFAGGWHWQALAYALWESFMCLAMCIGLVYLFQRHFNRQGQLAGFLVPNAYTAYIIHAPVITSLAFAARDVALYPLLKWVLVALVAVPLCFGLSGLIRKLPYTERVL